MSPTRRARSSASAAACGPVASSAIVSADIAMSIGRSSALSISRSITTEVSTRPRGRRSLSATTPFIPGPRSWVLIYKPIDVGSELLVVDMTNAGKRGDGDLGRHKPAAANRPQLTDRRAIASHDERFASVELSHDLAAVVAQLSLTDLTRHDKTSVAPLLHPLRTATKTAPATPAGAVTGATGKPTQHAGYGSPINAAL